MADIYIVKEYAQCWDCTDETALGYYSSFEGAKKRVDQIVKAINAGKFPVNQLKLCDDFYMEDPIAQSFGHIAAVTYEDEFGDEVTYAIEKSKLDSPHVFRSWETE